MLTTLRIKNLALVPDLTLELEPGYIAITGETGAGKSVIIGALNLVLGERADRSLIRTGADSCTVEAVFNLDKLEGKVNAFLDERGIERAEEGRLVLKRVFSSAGTNRQFINGSPATLTVLAELGGWLVDMHGPHDHQSLLHAANQLEILDAYAGLEVRKAGLAELVRQRSELHNAKRALIIDERSYAQQLDLLRFQVQDISAAKLIPGEESELESEYSRASNVARLTELSQSALSTISDEDTCLLNLAGSLGRTLQELAKLDSEGQALSDLHEEAVANIQELQRELSRYADSIEIDPARLQELEQRLDLIQSLKRKYGSTLEEVINFGNDARQKLQALESRDADLESINREISRIEDELWALGNELTVARKKIIPKLAKAAVNQLADLGFKQSSLDVELKTAPRKEAFASENLSSKGFDSVEFLFAPNAGEPARPLRAIASSGEIARVMLALKTVLAAQDSIPLLVFDEVDANVGGETAVAVGDKMQQIGGQRQVLCITHLAQVAVAARTHFVVTKEIRDGRTVSTIERIGGKRRTDELARMLGGGEAARKHAETLVRAAAALS